MGRKPEENSPPEKPVLGKARRPSSKKMVTPESILASLRVVKEDVDPFGYWPDVDWNNTEWAKFGNFTNSPPPR